MRRAALLLVAAAAATPPPFSWDRVPTYAFCAPLAHDWNATELAWLAGTAGDRFAPPPQWVAMGYVAGDSMPPVGRHSEEKQTRMGRSLKQALPDLPVWWGTAWGVLDKFDVAEYFLAHPELLLHCGGSVVEPPVMDWGNPRTREVWASFFHNMSAGAYAGGGDPPFSGVLVDGLGPLTPPYDQGKAGYNIYANPNCSAAERRAFTSGLAAAAAAARGAQRAGAVFMCNGHDQLFAPRPAGAGAAVGEAPPGGGLWCDGNFEEEWGGQPADVVLMLRAGQIPGYMFAARSVFSPDRGEFNRSLAAFLVAAVERQYYLHFSQYDCGQQPGAQMQYYREYAQPLGPPTAPPNVPNWGGCDFDGCFMTRRYARGARVLYNATRGRIHACVLWPDGSDTDYEGGCDAARRLIPP